jgi:hypothetical protein
LICDIGFHQGAIMRRRNVLSAILGAVIAGLVAVIVLLGGCAGPGADAGITDPAPETTVTTPAAPTTSDHAPAGGVIIRGAGSGGGGAVRHPGRRSDAVLELAVTGYAMTTRPPSPRSVSPRTAAP